MHVCEYADEHVNDNGAGAEGHHPGSLCVVITEPIDQQPANIERQINTVILNNAGSNRNPNHSYGLYATVLHVR